MDNHLFWFGYITGSIIVAILVIVIKILKRKKG